MAEDISQDFLSGLDRLMALFSFGDDFEVQFFHFWAPEFEHAIFEAYGNNIVSKKSGTLRELTSQFPFQFLYFQITPTSNFDRGYFKGRLQWIEGKAPSREKFDWINERLIYFQQMFCTPVNEKNYRFDFKPVLLREAVLNLFLILTTYPVDSIVPLRELMSEGVFEDFRGDRPLTGSLWVWLLGFLIETLQRMNVPLPAKYYPKLMALGRDVKLNETLAMLDRHFVEWESKMGKNPDIRPRITKDQ